MTTQALTSTPSFDAERAVAASPDEARVRADYQRQAARIQQRIDALPQSFHDERARLAGEIAPGARADLVTVSLDSLRTAGAAAGTALETAVFAASAADVRTVVISGRDVVRDGTHLLLPDVPRELARTIHALLD